MTEHCHIAAGDRVKLKRQAGDVYLCASPYGGIIRVAGAVIPAEHADEFPIHIVAAVKVGGVGEWLKLKWNGQYLELV